MAKLSFIKKKGEKIGDIPVSKIKLLSSKGLSEPEIVEALKKEGYPVSIINKVLRETVKGVVLPAKITEELRPPSSAEIKAKAAGAEPATETPKLPSHEMPKFPLGPLPPTEPAGRGPVEEEIEEEMPLLPPPKPPEHRERISKEEVEEIVEAILEEKWEEFEEKFGKMEAKVDEIGSKVAEMESVVNELKQIKKTDIQEIKENVNTYKDLFTEMTSRMEATEKVVKDSLAPMMETMRSLSEAVKALKKRK